MAAKLVVFISVLCLTQVWAAPKPIDWKQVGRNALNFGKRALPIGCQLLNGQQMPPQAYYGYGNIPYQYPSGQHTPPQAYNGYGNVPYPDQYPSANRPFQYYPPIQDNPPIEDNNINEQA